MNNIDIDLETAFYEQPAIKSILEGITLSNPDGKIVSEQVLSTIFLIAEQAAISISQPSAEEKIFVKFGYELWQENPTSEPKIFELVEANSVSSAEWNDEYYDKCSQNTFEVGDIDKLYQKLFIRCDELLNRIQPRCLDYKNNDQAKKIYLETYIIKQLAKSTSMSISATSSLQWEGRATRNCSCICRGIKGEKLVGNDCVPCGSRC